MTLLRLLPVLSAALMLGGVPTAQALDALATTAYLDLPAQPLSKSVGDLGWQANVEILCLHKYCQGISAPRVLGMQTVQHALETLLRGSGLRYKPLDDHTIGVFPAANEVAPATPPAPSKQAKPTESQKSAAADASVEEVVIGTNLIGVDPLGPLTTYSRREIEESGAPTLEDFLSRLPQNLNSNSKATNLVGAPQNGERGSSYNFWGLGERGTLVLVDGHRIAESAMGSFVDVSLIPLASVDRVEVLPEGASAIYGADAVAGVINIALRKNFSGLEVDVRNSWPARSGADQSSAALTLGKDWGSGNSVFSFTYRRDQRLLSTDRSYSDTPGYTLLPALTDYDGYLHLHQDVSTHLRVDIDGLYSNRQTEDDADYIWGGLQVGPYHQQGVANQYYLAPVLKWSLGADWHAIADFDLSQNRFNETTVYGAEAISGAAVYSTLSEARVRTMDDRLDGPIFKLPAGKAKLAVGLGQRWEDYHSYGIHSHGQIAGSLHRYVSAAYAELDLPLICPANEVPAFRTLDLRLAVRGERYSGAGSTGNPKIDLLWEPLENLNFRASYGTSFAIARYTQTVQRFNAVAIQRAKSPACPSGSCLVAEEFGASPTYRPERSRSYTVGFDWNATEPAGLRARADFYSVDYFDQIAAPPDAHTLLDHSAAFAGLVVPNPSPDLLSEVFARAETYPQGVLDLAGPYSTSDIAYYVDGRTRNFARTRAMGIDFNVDYDLQSPYGLWTLGFSGTRVLKLDNRASPIAPELSVADTFAHPLSHRYQARVGLRAESGMSAQLRINYLGNYTNNQVIPAEPVASWTTLDATFVFSLKKLFPDFGSKARLELSLDNIMDRGPPYVQTRLVPDGYDPVLANALGRVINLRFVVRL